MSRLTGRPGTQGGLLLLAGLTGLCAATVVAVIADRLLLSFGHGASPAALAGGVGLAGLVIGGKRLWPAFAAGHLFSFLLLPGAVSPAVALVSAAGDTVAVLAGAHWVLRLRLPAKPDSLEAMLRYILFGVGTVAVISSTVTVVADMLLAPGAIPLTIMGDIWHAFFASFAWTLIVGSFIQSSWSERRQPLPGALALPIVAIAVAEGVFLYFTPASVDYIWCVMPLLVWAGIVGKVRGVSVGLLMTLVPIIIAYLSSDMLPADFLWPDFHLFLGVAAPTALLMAALNMESSLHRRSQRSLALGNPREGRFEYYPRSHRFKIDQDVKELLGINSEGSIIRENLLLDEVLEEDLPALTEFLEELSAGPTLEARHVEFRVVTSRGEERWLGADGVSVVPHLGGDGLPTASYGVIRDVSEQKESEQKLMDSDRFLHCVIENLVTFVAVLTPDGTVVETNRPHMQSGPRDGVSVIGQKLWDAYWWGDSAEVQKLLVAAVADARDGRVTEHDLQMHNGGGDLTWVEVQIAPLRDDTNTITHIIISGSDLTERLEAEARAHRMAAIIESTPDFVGITGPDGKFIYVSPGGLNLMNAPADADFTGQDVLSVHPEEERERLMTEALAAARSTGVWEGQTHLLTVDGHQRPVSQVLIGHFNQQGDLQQVSTVMRDMTEQKRAEEQQRILLRELAHRVKNVLAIIQGFTRQTLLVHPDPEDFSRVFRGRVASLAASHSLLTESGWSGAQLKDVIRTQLVPSVPAGAERLTVEGPDVLLPSELATTLGLILYELGMNAAQYGGWAGADGAVSVEWRRDGNILRVAWRETDSRAVDDESVRRGFGSSLLDMSVRSVERRWEGRTFLLDFEVTLFEDAGMRAKALAEQKQ